MGAATALPVRDVRVEPGATSTATLMVRNTGQVVDQFTIDVVGNCAEWTKVEPKVVNLLPGADVEVTVTFAPARSPQVAAGVVPFGIRVLSREDPPGSTVAEGSVEVAAFSDVQIELVPRQSKGRRRGKHQLAIDNNGNQPVSVQVTAADEEEALDFAFDHSAATIEPGAAAFIRVVARPEKRFFKGADRQHPFVVSVVPTNAEPIATRGIMTQRQLLPAWLIPAVAILAALAIAAVILYETLLKPTIDSRAEDAAKKAASKANKSLASKADSAASKANSAAAAAKQASSVASQAASKAGITPSKGGSAPAPAPTGLTGPGGMDLSGGQAVSFPFNLSATQTPGDSTTFTTLDGPALTSKQVLVVTYVSFQNPRGDKGTLLVTRGSGSSAKNLYTENLANWRDFDSHLNDSPLLFSRDSPLSVSVNCQKPAAGTTCRPNVLITGRIVSAKKNVGPIG
jgi:hypothetical protein